jgi:hypothetical protein
MHPTRPLADVSLVVAVSNWLVAYGPTMVTVVGGLIGAAYYVYLIWDLYDRRRKRSKPRKKR